MALRELVGHHILGRVGHQLLGDLQFVMAHPIGSTDAWSQV